MKKLKYVYRILLWLGVAIIVYGFVHFVESLHYSGDITLIVFGFAYVFAAQEFYETYDSAILDEGDLDSEEE